MRLLRLGSRGPDVADWQRFLADQGFDPGRPDGIFGEGTKAATIKFQKKFRLGADGIAGNNTVGKAMMLGLKKVPAADDPPPKTGITRIVTIGGVPVNRSASRKAVFFTAGMQVDADGSPHAYKIRNQGLDLDDNAKNPAKPNGRWVGVATKSNGEPIVQGPGDPAPGFLVSTTSLTYKGEKEGTPQRYVDSEKIPYIVIPGGSNGKKIGARTGDYALVINTNTKARTPAIIADVGPRTKIGEASIFCATAILGKKLADPRRGGTDDKIVRYILFPGSGDRFAHTLDEITQHVESLLHDLSSDEVLAVST